MSEKKLASDSEEPTAAAVSTLFNQITETSCSLQRLFDPGIRSWEDRQLDRKPSDLEEKFLRKLVVARFDLLDSMVMQTKQLAELRKK